MGVTEAASWVVLVVAGLTAAGVAFKWLRGGFRTVEDGADLLASAGDIKQLVAMSSAIKRIVERELNHNHGSSIKDDTTGTAVSVRLAHARIDEIHDLFSTFAEANHLVLPLIETALRSSPPPEEYRDDPHPR